MFRLLGLHPGPDVSVHAAASLAAVNGSQASRLLRELTRHCLVTEHAPGRYAFHDLLRAYAAGQARDHVSAPDRHAAVGRIHDHYLHTAAHAAFLLQPVREKVALAAPRRGVVPEQPGDHRQALAWFEAEHRVLLAAVTVALDMGADSHAWQLPWAMAGDHVRARAFGEQSLALIAKLGDCDFECHAWCTLGYTELHLGDPSRAGPPGMAGGRWPSMTTSSTPAPTRSAPNSPAWATSDP
jgi:hypothetical protein